MGLSSIEDYWIHFQNNEKLEREVLQSLMTTHYTFFFREYAHFEMLESWIEQEIVHIKDRYNKSQTPLRVWSAACSRGQEVYSLAMFLEFVLLKKHGVPYKIIGTDIDSDSVNYARNGVYSLREVNTIPQMYLSGLWKKGSGAVKDFAAVHPKLKEKTEFDVLNLLEINSKKNIDTVDVIFCRNVFIYFSEENVKKIALDLASKIEKNGLLITGVSEPIRFKGWNLTSIGPSCYKKCDQEISTTNSSPAINLKPVHEPKHVQAKNESYSVLCVDDSPTIQTLIRKIYSQDPNCKDIDSAVNGQQAREKLNSKKYDIITLDIHMPVVNGIEFLETLYNKKNDPPVLMISSVNRTDIELATRALSLGAFDYIEKPAMNNLVKSADEILTKTKMAIRNKNITEQAPISFDQSIGQKIVVPDASQCVRIIISSVNSVSELEQILKGQKNEYRSPAQIIFWSGSEFNIESKLLNWTDKPISTLKDSKTYFRPNQIYILKETDSIKSFEHLKFNSASLQILSESNFDFSILKNIKNCQVLIDEKVSDYSARFERQSKLSVSDVTPAISFPSLSVEFFADLRKAAA